MGLKTDLESRFDEEIVMEFISHFVMASESLEGLILGLKNPLLYKRNVDELFRIFHNIKSATGFLQIRELNTFVIKVENFLEELRAHESVTQAQIDWLLLVDSQMNKWSYNIKLDESLVVLDDALRKLP